ncbi:hypothetical protein A2U01_0078812, partial [Trifolium medium]|nr:hypothetical protein [Trifolium medium]
MTLDCDF